MAVADGGAMGRWPGRADEAGSGGGADVVGWVQTCILASVIPAQIYVCFPFPRVQGGDEAY